MISSTSSGYVSEIRKPFFSEKGRQLLVICQEEALTSGRFFQQGHLDLLHTARSDSNHSTIRLNDGSMNGV